MTDLMSKIERLDKKDILKLCRFCVGKKKEMKNISRIHISGYKFSEMFSTCTGYQLENDNGLPDRICSECTELLPKLFSFVKTSQEATRVLKLVLLNQTIDPFHPTINITTPKTEETPGKNIQELKIEETYDGIAEFVAKEAVMNGETFLEEAKNFDSLFLSNSDEEQCSLSQIMEIENAKKSGPNVNKPLVKTESNYSPGEKEEAVYSVVYGCVNCDEHFMTKLDVKGHNRKHCDHRTYAKICRFCLKNFSHQKYLSNHMRKFHTEMERFQCGYCGSRWKDVKLLRLHMISHVSQVFRDPLLDAAGNDDATTDSQNKKSNPKRHACEICNKIFRDITLLIKHKMSHDKSRPYVCKSGNCKSFCFATKFELDVHTHVRHYEEQVPALTAAGDAPFICKFCPKTFATRRNLRMHMVSHRPDRKHQCRFCEKAFNFRHHLMNHERVHTKECPFLCQKCGGSFSTTDKLAIHLRRHSNSKPYSCELCLKSFLTCTQLKAHKMNHDGSCFMCATCGKTFKALATLKKHTLYHHGTDISSAAGEVKKKATASRDEGGGTCHICGVTQDSMKEMDNHMKSHICLYFCPKCSKGFPITSALEAHIKTHSAGERLHVCVICCASFNRPEHLRGHVARVHSGPRPVPCPHCPRRFVIRADLNKHLRIHTGERPYVCSVCKRGFAQSTSLRVHMRIHTGERPYICNVCHKGFCSSGPLYLHMRTHTKREKDPQQKEEVNNANLKTEENEEPSNEISLASTEIRADNFYIEDFVESGAQ